VIVFTIAGWLLVGIEPNRNTVEVVQDDQAVTMTVDEADAAGLLTTDDRRMTSESPLLVLLPKRTGFNFQQGKSVTPEYMALLLGLTIYTASFIAEIVRAGIQAVPYGQVEAARSIGLPYGRTLRLVVLPQALRVIIPPLGNQYLNLAKNSSLALAIAYPDLFQVTTTIMNTSGQSVAGMMMVMVTYLLISLSISAVTNFVNRRLRLVTN
jgi:general L-amino acid transport system permease protein